MCMLVVRQVQHEMGVFFVCFDESEHDLTQLFGTIDDVQISRSSVLCEKPSRHWHLRRISKINFHFAETNRDLTRNEAHLIWNFGLSNIICFAHHGYLVRLLWLWVATHVREVISGFQSLNYLRIHWTTINITFEFSTKVNSIPFA